MLGTARFLDRLHRAVPLGRQHFLPLPYCLQNRSRLTSRPVLKSQEAALTPFLGRHLGGAQLCTAMMCLVIYVISDRWESIKQFTGARA